MEGNPPPNSSPSSSSPNLHPVQGEQNPVDWIKQGLQKQTTSLQQAVPGFIPSQAPQQASPIPVPDPAAPVPPVAPPATPTNEAQAFVDSLVADANAAAPASAPAVDPEDAPVEGEDPKSPEQSLKGMRKIIRKVNTELESEREARLRAEAEVEKFKTGEAIPEVLKEKDQRIEELSHYEKLHGLKLSPEYQQKFVEPYNNTIARAAQLAKDYGVDDEVIQEALHIENKRELNSFLRSHFDEVGTLEVRNLVDAARNISQQAQAAEQKPQDSMVKLRGEFQVQQREREEKRVTTIQDNAKNGWRESVKELASSGEYPELTRNGDPEHDRIVNEVTTAAAAEFGKMVTLLGQGGVRDLPADAAKIMAKRYLMSQAAGIMSKSRAHHHSRSEELLSQSRRTAGMIRPQIGGVADASPAPAAPAAARVEDKAEALLNSVLRKRG